MKIIVSNPMVAPHVKQDLMAYEEAGYLTKFYTSFVDHQDNKLSSFLRKFKSLANETQRRSFNLLPIEKIATRPFPELLRSLSAREMGPVITDRIWEWSELGFDKWVASNIDSSINAVHTFEHAALTSLKKARSLQIFSVYEQPSQHHTFFSNIARQQIELYPELNSAASELLINTKAQRRNQRRDEELQLASIILCNSTFTKKTLVAGGVPSEKIRVIPLAFPPVVKNDKPASANKPLIFLYAGNQSLRKASHILYQAWRSCNFKADEAQLWLIGKMLLPEQLRTNLPGTVMIKENIPHDELMNFYEQTDVFVLPTLADGFGMVVTEAMSQGVPVIASENSCGPDIIEHSKDGWLIPAGDIEALAIQMQWCVNNREQVFACSKAARLKAADWQWPQYRKKLADTIFNEWQKFNEAKPSV